jgi:sugar lactone lactonase YvrE
MRAEQLTGPDAVHGEGPCWLSDDGSLLWVDMLAGDVLRLGEGGFVDRWHVDTVAALVRPRAGGGLVVVGERAVHLASAYGATPKRSVTVVADADLRFNEGTVDPWGSLWCGTTSWSDTVGTGTLYRFDADVVAAKVLEGVGVSNGLAWTADGSRAYYADSATGRVDVLDASPNGLAHRRPFVTVDEDEGIPDGLCLDADGGVWVALWQGAAVHRYDQSGRLSDRVEVPARLVTSCAFGGPSFSELFITTSRLGEDDRDTGAGSVFRTLTTTTGVQAPPANL